MTNLADFRPKANLLQALVIHFAQAEPFDTIRPCANNTTSARCFSTNLLAGFLGLGRPTAFALLPSRLQLPEVFRPSFRDLLPTLPSKLDGGGIFFLRHNSEGLALSPDRIMHDEQSRSNETQKQFFQNGIAPDGAAPKPPELFETRSSLREQPATSLRKPPIRNSIMYEI